MAPAFAAVTVCGQAGVAVQTLPVHDPSGSIENCVVDVTFPSEFPFESKPWTVNACEPPAVIVAVEGLMTMLSTATPCRDAVPVTPKADAVTVWAPATEIVHVGPEQEPLGVIVKLALAVASPVELS